MRENIKNLIVKENTNDKQSISPSASFTSNIFNAAQQHVLNLFNQQYDTRLLFHSYQHTHSIVGRVDELGKSLNLSDSVIEIALLAGWFHATGFLFDYNDPVSKSTEQAKAFLNAQRYPSDKLNKVLAAINVTNPTINPISKEEQLLSDAIASLNAGDRFFEHRPLLRLEWEFLQNRKLSTYEWNQIQLQELLNTRFHTDYGKLTYGPYVAQNIRTQKERVEKKQLNQLQLVDGKEAQLRKFQRLVPKNSGSAAIQTYFRTNYRNHINLSAIADNKANIMISVNAILISVIISILSYRNISQTQPMVLLPVVIFLATGLSSLICAVLAIRPKVTSSNQGPIKMEEAKKNVIFFGNFINLNLEQFEEAMDTVLRDSELLYGNMTRDLYFLGKVLDKKYRFLTMSYNIFMIGFAATVITFMIALFS